MNTSSWIAVVVVVLIILGGGWYFYSNQTPAPASNTQTNTGTTDTTTNTVTNTGPSLSATVTLTADGFAPSTVTIAKGGSVTFINQSSEQMLVASDPHPTHQSYDGTTMSQHCKAGYSGPAPFDQCAIGTSFMFTFDQVGSWGYHNHIDHGMTGTIIVQ